MTGTHPGCTRLQCFASLVHSLRLVQADGSVKEIDRASPLFSDVGVSLGLLGVVSTVTVRVTGEAPGAIQVRSNTAGSVNCPTARESAVTASPSGTNR